MIVRINQFDACHADSASGWPDSGIAGPIDCPWPEDSLAFELLILPSDEQHQPLPRTFRQAQLRQLIPDVISAMQETGEMTVVRLDGTLCAGETIDALKYLADAQGYGRYCLSSVEKFADDSQHPVASIRMLIPPDRLGELCADPNVGLDRNVRLRIFSLPEELVNPLLDIVEPDDERWDEVLSHCGFILGNTRAMQSLQLIMRRYSPEETRARLTQRLVGMRA